MDKYIFLLLFIGISFTQLKAQSSFDTNSSTVFKEVEELKKETQILNVEVATLKTRIEELKEQNKAQSEYYKTSQNSMIWVMSLVFLILSAGFSLFIWFFKKPDEIWNKLKETQSNANQLLQKLDQQYKYQESLFVLGPKGLYSYSNEDWNIIEVFASKASNVISFDRSAHDWFFIGLWDYKNKDFNKSIKAFLKATELDSQFEMAFRNLGNAYGEIGENEKSIKYYKKAIDLNPKDDITLNNLGVTYSSMGKIEEASSCFKKSIKIKPTVGYTYTNLFEHNLINEQAFDQQIEKLFLAEFSDDLAVFPIYQMMKVYKKIANGEQCDLLITEWLKSYDSIGSQENYEPIKNWIATKQSPIKSELEKALDFFKGYED
ncbi:MAG: tetratricopeptide repeat protein [Bacteroidota bacterium]